MPDAPFPRSPGDLDAELAIAIEAAQRAGALLVGAFRQVNIERRHGRHDVVTDIDRASEALIMASLAASFPADRRLGEETGLAVPRRPSTRTWIIDPLDGTVNYVAGLPFWCVSIALAIGNRIELGVIHDPLQGETIVAMSGRGAWHMDPMARLEMRHLRRTADAVVSADPGGIDDPAQQRISELRKHVRAVRALGSTALSLTSLATGRLDGVLQVRGLQAVDIAAAGLIAREAGARITDARGGPWIVVAGPSRGTGIAAGRPGVHHRLLGGKEVPRGALPHTIDLDIRPGGVRLESASDTW